VRTVIFIFHAVICSYLYGEIIFHILLVVFIFLSLYVLDLVLVSVLGSAPVRSRREGFAAGCSPPAAEAVASVRLYVSFFCSI
jgi:hypothetical protein